jgi:hypothetical protein
MTKASMTPPLASPNNEAIAMSRTIPSTRLVRVPRAVTRAPVIRGCRFGRFMGAILAIDAALGSDFALENANDVSRGAAARDKNDLRSS